MNPLDFQAAAARALLVPIPLKRYFNIRNDSRPTGSRLLCGSIRFDGSASTKVQMVFKECCSTRHFRDRNASSRQSLEIELTGLLNNHPQIKAAEKGLQSSRQGIKSALSDFYPSVNLSSDVGYENIDSPSARSGNAPEGDSFGRTRNNASLTVTQNLFNGYASASAVRTARLNRELASISLEGTRQNTIFEGVQLYIDVLRQRRLIELALENEATIQRQLNLEDERVQRGSGVAVDVLQAKSRLQIAKERRVNFEGALEEAISRYTQVYGHPPDMEAMLDPEPPIELVPSELNKSIDIAVVENPAVGNSGTTVEVARERRRTVASELFPTVDLEGTYNYEKHNNGTLAHAVTIR